MIPINRVCMLFFSRNNVDFYFKCKSAKRLTCSCLYLGDTDTQSTVPEGLVAAYVDSGHVQVMRKGIVFPNFGSLEDNQPVEAIYQKRWKKIQPPKPLHDPYIAALLIALAQKQRQSSKKTVATEFTVCYWNTNLRHYADALPI